MILSSCTPTALDRHDCLMSMVTPYEYKVRRRRLYKEQPAPSNHRHTRMVSRSKSSKNAGVVRERDRRASRYQFTARIARQLARRSKFWNFGMNTRHTRFAEEGQESPQGLAKQASGGRSEVWWTGSDQGCDCVDLRFREEAIVESMQHERSRQHYAVDPR